LDAYWEIQSFNKKNINHKDIRFRKRKSLFIAKTNEKKIELTKDNLMSKSQKLKS